LQLLSTSIMPAPSSPSIRRGLRPALAVLAAVLWGLAELVALQRAAWRRPS
jgi:hypothetical protein